MSDTPLSTGISASHVDLRLFYGVFSRLDGVFPSPHPCHVARSENAANSTNGNSCLSNLHGLASDVAALKDYWLSNYSSMVSTFFQDIFCAFLAAILYVILNVLLLFLDFVV
jgi:hypothetical protein